MSRAETIPAERRRRNTDALSGRRQRLAVDEAALDREKYQYRWANDVDNRIHALTVQDDWEIVPDRAGEVRPDSSGMGAEVATPAGGGTTAVLLRKPKQYYTDDKAAEQRRIDELEASLKQGAVPGAGDASGSYVPKDGITIGHGGRS
jgi:hypothetical protein